MEFPIVDLLDERHADPSDPPQRRGHRRRGRGLYAHDRPPIVGTVGRESGQVRLRVVWGTTRQTLEALVYRFTHAQAVVFTDKWRGYDHIIRVHQAVHHGKGEWARDDDGDGKREIHVNTM